MSLFNFFNKPTLPTTKELKLNWTHLNNLAQLNELSNLSKSIPVIIFKHSTSCIISKTVLKRFEKEYVSENKVALFYLDLLNYRSISNEISLHFNVVHQSPQLLVIKNNICVYSSSHESIAASILENLI